MKSNLLPIVIVVALTCAVTFGVVTALKAAEPCCAHCGCGECCKTCRLVREEKKVTITCWGSVCEDFCVGGRNTPGCQHREEVCESCDECDPKVPYAKAKAFVWTDWIPGCSAKIYTKKKLMKKTITKSVPSFKWVVEDLCEKCQSKCAEVEVPADATIPALPPIVNAKVISAKKQPSADYYAR